MDLQQALGASESPTVEKFCIYLPDRDRQQNSVSTIGDWIEAAITLLTDITGGATRLPAAMGSWDNGNGLTVRENTSVIYSFIRDPRRFEANVGVIATFLHKFGAQTNQGEVMVEFHGEGKDRYTSRAYYIRDFSPSNKRNLPV